MYYFEVKHTQFKGCFVILCKVLHNFSKIVLFFNSNRLQQLFCNGLNLWKTCLNSLKIVYKHECSCSDVLKTLCGKHFPKNLLTNLSLFLMLVKSMLVKFTIPKWRFKKKSVFILNSTSSEIGCVKLRYVSRVKILNCHAKN